MQLMRLKRAPEAFDFDPRKTDAYLQIVAIADPGLLAKLEFILDNGEAFDGYRQVNKAIYNAAIECIKADDLWIVKSVERGDGVGLRNLLWDKMEGGNESQRTIAAMQTPMNLNDIYYRFQSYGIDKYFAEVHSKLGKFERIGRVMDKMSVLSAILQHIGSQCLEYQSEANRLRTEFVKNKDSVTLRSAQLAFAKVETTHGLGVSSKGTPIPAFIPMSGPKQIPANISGFAGTKASKSGCGNLARSYGGNELRCRRLASRGVMPGLEAQKHDQPLFQRLYQVRWMLFFPQAPKYDKTRAQAMYASKAQTCYSSRIRVQPDQETTQR